MGALSLCLRILLSPNLPNLWLINVALVVYLGMSKTRYNKILESSGILIVNERSVLLKDTEGKE